MILIYVKRTKNYESKIKAKKPLFKFDESIKDSTSK